MMNRNEAGKLSARLTLPLSAYSEENVSVRLDDGDGTIARMNLGGLLPLGHSGKTWQFKVKGNGFYKLKLQNLAPTHPNTFKLTAAAKKWFSSAAANQAAGSTNFTVTIGGQCFTHAVTRKSS